MSMKDGPLLLTNDDTKAILDIPSYVDALEIAYRQLGEGVAQNMPRQRLFVPLGEPDTHHWFNLHAGLVPGTNTGALRVNSGKVKFVTQFGTRRMEFPGTLVGLVHVFDLETGTLRGIIHDFYINPIRVACTSALGARYMARKDCRTMGLLGTGWQARWHLTAMMSVRNFERINIYSPNPEHRTRFVKQQQERTPGVEFVAVDTGEKAVRGADVVVAATNAIEPVMKGEWIKPGAHVISISGGDRLDQRKEIDEETVTRSSLVVVNSKVQVELDEQPDILPLIKNGKVSMDQIVELSQIVGKAPPQRAFDDITFHFNNTGMGIQFAAIGARMIEAAEAKGIGTRLPYTWRGRAI
ncbi:MAG: ornithine cyclodeaminase family protein [Betaproteobacteria bacterium]|nr:MAG: ornithine cyclodeaminase family protein [Betaproteobacteria bacterium]